MPMTVSPLPKWAMQRYARLWNRYENNEFSHKDASETLKLTKNNTSVTINLIKKSGWLTVELSQEDSRKRIYLLKSPKQVIKEMGDSQ